MNSQEKNIKQVLLLIRMLGFPHKEGLGEKNLLLPLVSADRQHLQAAQEVSTNEGSAFRSRSPPEATLERQVMSEDSTECLRCALQVNFVLCVPSQSRPSQAAQSTPACLRLQVLRPPDCHLKQLGESSFNAHITFAGHIKLSEEVLILNLINVSGMYQT